MADDPISPMPAWVPRLSRRLLSVLESWEPHEARALLVFLRDHEEAYRPVLPPTSDRPQ